MLAILMLFGLAISGGLFVGTILHSVNQKSQFDRALRLYQNLWT